MLRTSRLIYNALHKHTLLFYDIRHPSQIFNIVTWIVLCSTDNPVSLPPRVVPLTPSLTVREGSNAVLVCSVENTPQPYTALYWDHQGTRIPHNKRLRQKQTFSVNILRKMYKLEHAVMSLAINHVTLRDAGVYTCGAVTHIGRGETRVQLLVKGNILSFMYLAWVVLCPKRLYVIFVTLINVDRSMWMFSFSVSSKFLIREQQKTWRKSNSLNFTSLHMHNNINQLVPALGSF